VIPVQELAPIVITIGLRALTTLNATSQLSTAEAIRT